MVVEISVRTTHLWSAGITYRGATPVLVAAGISSQAPVYASRWCRSARSETENFHSLSSVPGRSSSRFFCSSFEMCRKNLSITVPFRTLVAFEGADILVPVLPELFVPLHVGEALPFDQIRVDLHHQHHLVVGPVEDPDLAAGWEVAPVAPEEVVVGFLYARHPEAGHPAAPGVDAGHHVPDRPVLSGGVRPLQDDQHRVRITRPEQLQGGIELPLLHRFFPGPGPKSFS